jgi:hypothetical protein
MMKKDLLKLGVEEDYNNKENKEFFTKNKNSKSK